MTGVFIGACADYALAGWPCVIPVPPDAKFPPPEGFTGAAGADTGTEQLVEWATGKYAAYSVALRMPEGVIGIDVDHYEKNGSSKHGADTLAEREAEWGPLPPTWCSTARGSGDGPGLSRIMFFRAPVQRYTTKLGPDIDIIQRHHRYAVVAPSPHAEAGGAYRWYGPDGAQADRVPEPGELAELPPAWAQHLAEGAAAAGPAAADANSGQALLGQLLADDREACADTVNAELDALRELAGALPGSRHDIMTERVYHLVQLGAEGHPGTGLVLARLRARWDELTAGKNRDAEWDGMALTAARKAVTHIGAGQQRERDPCLIMTGLSWEAPAPADASGTQMEGLVSPRLISVREYIGAQPFDPPGGLDHGLAQHALERMYPALRYAADADTWLLRGPWAWTAASGDLSQWAVTELTWLMPRGNPDADKATGEGQLEIARAARRKRFGTAASANGIARKMKTHVMAGTHPCAAELSALDAQPEILWAGGAAWDLRASGNGPVQAGIDPGTPHLHSAGVTPQPRPTPLWDAYTRAVWPDKAVRAWALRVLSIAFTGYPDKTLPILLGETDRGKTEMISLLMSVLGSYAHAADPRLLSAADRSHASIIAVLKGRRLSFIDEAPRAGHLAQERLKQLTGGSALTGNLMNKNPVTFAPTHTLILTANPESEPVLTDAAVRRRVRLLPCDGDPAEVIAARAAIGPLRGIAWQAEAPGVLAAMMAQAAAWLADRGSAGNETAPVSIRATADQIAAGQDYIRSWMEEETEPSDTGTQSRMLYKEFVRSCRDSGFPAGTIPTETRWGRRLTELGFPPESRRDAKYRKLRVRLASFMGLPGPVPPSAEVAGHAADVSGSGPVVPGLFRVSEQPDTPHPPRSNPPSSSFVSGVSGWDTTIEQVREKETHAIYREQGETNPTRHETRHDTRSDLVKHPVSGTANQSPDPSQAQEAPPKRKKPAKPKAPKREGPDPELTGPVLSLPAVVTRDGQVLPCTVADAAVAVNPARPLTVDVETTGYPPGHPDYALRTVQLGNENLAAVFDAGDEASCLLIREALEKAPVLHAHSAVADLVPLEQAGLCDERAWERMDDTVLHAKLADPALSGSDADGLKDLARDVLGDYATAPAAAEARKKLFASGKWLMDTKALTPVERSGWAQVDSRCETMIRYAASDVLDTAALPRVLPSPDPAILARERSMQRICARVSHRGMRLDPDHVHALLSEHRAAKAELAQRISAAYGIANPDSPQQVAPAFAALGVLLPRTDPSAGHPEGQPSTKEAVLTPIRKRGGEAGELAGMILDFRDHATALKLILEPFGVYVDHGDGRVRPVIYTLGADTGRTSCVRPNLQQLSREGGIRACITADEGMVIISADFQAVELRTAAALSGDAALYQMIMEGDAARARGDSEGAKANDLHWKIARQVWGPAATKSDRYNAKRGVFGRLYGSGIPGIAATLGITAAEAQAVADTLDAMAPGVAAWSGSMRQYVRSGGTSIQAYSGRTIWLDKRQPHKSGNYSIQGNAREFLVDGLLNWSQTRWGDSVILPVHDEVLAVVPAEQAQEATQVLVSCMSTQLNGMPIVAEPSEPSFFWADAS